MAVPKATAAWVFVLNNPREEDDFYAATLASKVDMVYFVFQREIAPTTRTPHLQGYFYLREPRTTDQIHAGKYFGEQKAGLKYAGGSAKKNRVYCTKEDTRAPGAECYEWGDMPEQGSRTDWEEIRDMCKETDAQILDIVDKFPSQVIRYQSSIEKLIFRYKGVRMWPMNVWWLFGTSGVGKSRFIADKFPGAFWKQCGDQWFDGYAGEKVVVLDEFQSSFKWTFFLQMLDRYPFKVNTKGGMAQFVADTIVITSQYPPVDHYSNIRYRLPLWRRIKGGVFQVVSSADGYSNTESIIVEHLNVFLQPWSWPVWDVTLKCEELGLPTGIKSKHPAELTLLRRQNAIVLGGAVTGYTRFSPGGSLDSSSDSMEIEDVISFN